MTATYTTPPSSTPIPRPMAQAAPPAPWYPPAQQQPVYVQAPRGGGALSNVAMGIVIVLLAVVAAVAGWYIAQQTAPTTDEISRYQALASQEAFRTGQYQGIAEGRNFAVASEKRIAQYRAAIARQKAFNRGYRNGKRAGLNSYTGPRYSGYGGYGGGPRYYGPSRNQRAVGSALASAQMMANATGAPVDVEIY